jgi:hypothetical protein
MPRPKKVDQPVEDVVEKAPRAPRGKRPRREPAADGQHAEGQAPPAEQITQHAISRRAYELWEARGRQDGGHEGDWYRAERELRDGQA